MTILITGVAGFVARHFINFIATQQLNVKIIGVYNQTQPVIEHPQLVQLISCDLQHGDAVHQLIQTVKPTHILHLAAQSSVAKSWQLPAQTFLGNTAMAQHLLEACRTILPQCKILMAGSAEVYAPATEILHEDSALHTNNPYALSKYAQEQLCQIYKNHYGLNIVCTRAFNQIGPYQNTNFVVPSFAAQIIQQFNSGNDTINLATGNLEITRDFMDVRDTVKAYWQILAATTHHPIYNICSGIGTNLKTIIAIMQEIVGKEIVLQTDASKIRPTDNPYIVGDASTIYQDLGWKTTIPLKQTLADILMMAHEKK